MEFDDQLAREFYAAVRCGLLHEARTKDGWRAWARGPDGNVIDRDRRIVYRDNFQDALKAFVAWYGAALVADRELTHPSPYSYTKEGT